MLMCRLLIGGWVGGWWVIDLIPNPTMKSFDWVFQNIIFLRDDGK